ncbi:6-carboxytetrahydropterin synthase QueD [Pedobacter sp. L105]|uniref:6-carboxytetrahydropterin synthase QueD n=1 Tax=Pedobacter sp. L105 TaxID=1641871 RepID=UPI00131D4280|nr:6-carboxytetrahydropterin synthase QueD [Pedobacter sp. L105]
MIIYKVFRFDSAHYLPNVPKGHKCGGMHGHTYTAKIFISGQPGIYTGWIMDYTEIKNKIKPWIMLLDHQVLNTIPGLENPTSENLCLWLWEKIKPEIPDLCRIELNETPDSGVIYEG